jgi:hypothetical protein
LMIGSPVSTIPPASYGCVQVEKAFSASEQEGYRRMSRTLNRLLVAIGFMAALGVSAEASQRCLKDHKPFELTDDVVSWTMSAAPGSECIQGLRMSYMQIYGVVILKAPTKGKLVILGSGFQYIADPESKEADNFTLVVFGKNKRDTGESVLDIAVKPALPTMVSELPHHAD